MRAATGGAGWAPATSTTVAGRATPKAHKWVRPRWAARRGEPMMNHSNTLRSISGRQGDSTGRFDALVAEHNDLKVLGVSRRTTKRANDTSRPAVTDSSTSTAMPPDHPRHSYWWGLGPGGSDPCHDCALRVPSL